MISEPRPRIDEVEDFDRDTLVNNTGWIYDFFITQQQCKPVPGLKVQQYDLKIIERVNNRAFDKICFQVAAPKYEDTESVAQTVFYSLTTMLSYDIEDYTLDDVIHLNGIKKYIEGVLTNCQNDKNAHSIMAHSKPIVYKEPEFKPRHYAQL